MGNLHGFSTLQKKTKGFTTDTKEGTKDTGRREEPMSKLGCGYKVCSLIKKGLEQCCRPNVLY